MSDELERERGHAVDWRTGINTGEVVAGDAGAGQRFVSGDAVNVAARLEQAAAAREILIWRRDTHPPRARRRRRRARRPVIAKGKVGARRRHTADRAGRQPTGSAARRLDSPMVGRQRQRRQLAEAFEQAVDERVCHLFTILGAAGVGKSRLVAEFLDRTRRRTQLCFTAAACPTAKASPTGRSPRPSARPPGSTKTTDDDAIRESSAR